MSQRTMLWGGVGAVAVIAVVVGVLLTGGGDDVAADAIEFGVVRVSGSIPELPEAGPDPAAGLPAPRIVTQDTTGGDVEIDLADGTARLIGFFAHWCSHCQAELPRVVEWLDEHALPAGVEVVAITTAVDANAPNYPPSAWFRREGWAGPILVDNLTSDIARAYGLSVFPFWALVSGDGNIILRHGGETELEEFGALVDRAATVRR